MKKSKTGFFSGRNISFLAILVALTVVLQLFASNVKMFGVSLNFSLIPIVLGGVFFGMAGGAIMGFISGLVTFITCAILGGEPSTYFLFQANPVMLTIVCIGKTTAAGFLSGLFYSLISKKNKTVGAYVASVTVPVVNTGLYLLGLVLMKDSAAQFLGTEATASAVFVTVFLFIWLNFVLELAVNVVLAPAIHVVARVFEKQINKKSAQKAA